MYYLTNRRDEAMEALSSEIESELELVGVTAIEDSLQGTIDIWIVVNEILFLIVYVCWLAHVPETIEGLLRANIRVWMITGDKQVKKKIPIDFFKKKSFRFVMNVWFLGNGY